MSYWSSYLCSSDLRPDGSVTVLRDPSGMMTCYMRRNADHVTLASELTTLAVPGRTAIDYGPLARMFAGIDLLGRCTGIVGVEELLPGERLVVSAAGPHEIGRASFRESVVQYVLISVVAGSLKKK